MTILLIANTAIGSLVLLGRLWRKVGGRRAFRNPWVAVPVTCAALIILACLGAALLRRQRGLENPAWLAAVALGALFAGGFLGWAEGHHRREQVGEFFGGALRAFGDSQPLEHEAEAMADQMGPEKLLVLRRLLVPTGGAPGHEWLTVEWVDCRLQYLNRKLAVPAE